MPRYEDKLENSAAKSTETAWYYDWPAKYVTPTPDIADSLRHWRKEAVASREYMLDLQKEFGKSDHGFARFCQHEARHWMKIQRACTLMIAWFGEPDKGQRVERPRLWPVDLDHELDEIARRIVLKFG